MAEGGVQARFVALWLLAPPFSPEYPADWPLSGEWWDGGSNLHRYGDYLLEGWKMKKVLLLTSALLFWSVTMAARSDEADEDYRIVAVMNYLGLTEGPANPELRASWLNIYKYMTEPNTIGVMGSGKFTLPPETPRPEGYLGTRISRLQNPDDPEQKRVANILLKQPTPKERTEHYEAVLKRCFFAGWGVQITDMTTTGDVTRVTAMWIPLVRALDKGRASIRNPLEEVWEVKGEEVNLVKTISRGNAYISNM